MAVDEFEFFLDKHWSDGLPVVTPTEARVQQMLGGTTRPPDELVAKYGIDSKAIIERIRAVIKQ